jgi:hypothetical protein
MTTPSKKLLDMLEERRAGAEHTFQSKIDASGQKRWLMEWVTKTGAAVHLFPRTTQREPGDLELESAGVDELYGDITNPEFSDKRKEYNFRCLVEHSPSRQRLTTIGVREDRDIAFWYPYVMLEEAGLVDRIRFRGVDIGDLMVWDGTWYIAENVHREYYFGMTDEYFFTVAYCVRYQHDSLPINEAEAGCEFRV